MDALQASADIVEFQMTMDHWPPRPDGVLGPHGGGHFSLGATLQDLFASPQDPAFFLHHGMVDRMWTMWQAKDDLNRRYAINGTTVILNPAGTPEVTLETVMEWGILDRPRRVIEDMDPKAFGFCYGYT